MAALQRIRQGVRALLSFSKPVDTDLAQQYLTDEQLRLFMQMQRSEQLHSLNVLRAVLDEDPAAPPDLTLAALLHDVGKIRCPLAVWQKTVSVLVKRFAPQLDRRLSAEDRLTFWRAPFVVREHHPTWGADIMAQTGATERAVWLIRHHAEPLHRWQDHPHYALLAALRRADDLN